MPQIAGFAEPICDARVKREPTACFPSLVVAGPDFDEPESDQKYAPALVAYAPNTGETVPVSPWGIVKMRTLQRSRSAARAALVLLSLVFSLAFGAGLALAAERDAGNGPTGDDLTRFDIAEWHDKLYESTNALNSPGGGSSGLRGWAMMALAMFEASNTIDRTYAPYAVSPGSVPANIDLKIASRRVAVAKAAQVVLDGLFAPPPSQPKNALAHLRRFAHASEFAIHTAAFDPASPAYVDGVALGNFIGEEILKNRADDGHPPADTKVVNGTDWNQYQYGLPYFRDPPQSSGYTSVRPFGVAAFGLAGGDVTFVVPPLGPDSPEFKAQWGNSIVTALRTARARPAPQRPTRLHASTTAISVRRSATRSTFSLPPIFARPAPIY